MTHRTALLICGDDALSALPVGGLSLLLRAARAAFRAGATHITVLSPSAPSFPPNDPHLPIPTSHIPSPHPLSQASQALQHALPQLQDLSQPFWLLSVDQVVSPALFILPKHLQNKPDPKDKNKPDKKGQKNKKKSSGDECLRPVLSGERAPRLAWVNGEALAAALAASEGGEAEDLASLLDRLDCEAVEVTGGSAVWAPVASAADEPAAMNALMGALRKPLGRDADGIVAYYVNRPISLWMSRRLVHYPITPNQVTTFALVMGLAAGWVIWGGGWWSLVLGGFFLQLSSILDGVDGELARLRLTMSKSGEWYDTVCDDLINLNFIFGLAHANASLGHSWALPLGWISVCAGGLLVVLMYRELIAVGAASHNHFKWGFEGDAKSTAPASPLKAVFDKAVVAFSYIAKRDSYNLMIAVMLVLSWTMTSFLIMAIGPLIILTAYIVQKMKAPEGAKA
jgi:phosphatidylglycerophosphate synthase